MQPTDTQPTSTRQIIVTQLFDFASLGHLAVSAALPWAVYAALKAFGQDQQVAAAWLPASLPVVFWLCVTVSTAYAVIMCCRSVLPALLLWFAVLPCWLFAPAAVAWVVLAGSLVATLLFGFGLAARRSYGV